MESDKEEGSPEEALTSTEKGKAMIESTEKSNLEDTSERPELQQRLPTGKRSMKTDLSSTAQTAVPKTLEKENSKWEEPEEKPKEKRKRGRPRRSENKDLQQGEDTKEEETSPKKTKTEQQDKQSENQGTMKQHSDDSDIEMQEKKQMQKEDEDMSEGHIYCFDIPHSEWDKSDKIKDMSKQEEQQRRQWQMENGKKGQKDINEDKHLEEPDKIIEPLPREYPTQGSLGENRYIVIQGDPNYDFEIIREEEDLDSDYLNHMLADIEEATENPTAYGIQRLHAEPQEASAEDEDKQDENTSNREYSLEEKVKEQQLQCEDTKLLKQYLQTGAKEKPEPHEINFRSEYLINMVHLAENLELEEDIIYHCDISEDGQQRK